MKTMENKILLALFITFLMISIVSAVTIRIIPADKMPRGLSSNKAQVEFVGLPEKSNSIYRATPSVINVYNIEGGYIWMPINNVLRCWDASTGEEVSCNEIDWDYDPCEICPECCQVPDDPFDPVDPGLPK